MSDNILQKLLKPTSRGKIWWTFVGIIILVLATSLIDFGSYYNRAVDKFKAPFPKVKEIPFRLGLDLQGGTQLTYQADVSAVAAVDRSNAVEGVRALRGEILRRGEDEGFHPPTIYFPLIVKEAMMIEPTETETLLSLDRFIDTMKKIRLECDENPELVLGAPHTTAVKRVDTVLAAKKPEQHYECQPRRN
jgi:hypothetical protein